MRSPRRGGRRRDGGRGWGGRRIGGPQGKEVVEGGVDQGSSGGGGGAVRSGVEHFGGGKRAKVGLAAIPECQDSALLARQVRIVSVDVCGF